MTLTIVGAQLGDEGKGALVDRWGGPADVVVRFQGGDNAGHTVVHDGTRYELSLVPSGAVRGKTGVLGNGCVVNPRTLFDEVDGLRERGLDPDVRVARRAHVIMPYHRVLDGAEEGEKADDDLAAGTTGRGIGPTYEDKAGRRGVRVGDLLDPEALRDRLAYVVPRTRRLAEAVYGLDLDGETDLPVDLADAFDLDWLHETYADYGRRLREEEMTVDCGDYLATRRADGDRVLFEGAQGTSLDLDHGGYPYVTSSNPTAGGAATGTGLGPGVAGGGEVVGVVKAYLSKVGEGPMPTELDGPFADQIREEGGEFGTVTGRPRRIGWLDLPMLRHAARASGFTGVAVNHLDVLAGLDELRVAEAYEVEGERVEVPPATAERWAACEPVYREFEPWPEFDGRAAAEEGLAALPAAAREYLDHLSEAVDAPVYAVGVGPDRAETVEVTDPWGGG
jgi:adenylosuccinate synthase